MFHKLYNKYMRFLLPCVTVLFTLYGLLSFLIFRNLLQDDYEEKIQHFAMQQADNFSGYLRMAEQNMNYFLMQSNPISKDFDSATAFQKLAVMRSLTLDISFTFFHYKDALYVNPIHYMNWIPSLKSIQENFSIPDGEFRWFYLQGEQYMSDLLMCTKSVSDAQGIPFTVGVLLPVDNLLPKTSQFSKSTGIFSRGSFSSIVQCKSEAILLCDKTLTVQDEDNSSSIHENLTYQEISREIPDSPFTLSLTISRENLSKSFLMFFLGILLLCLFFFVTALLSLQRFLRKMTNSLEVLSNRFADYSQLDSIE